MNTTVHSAITAVFEAPYLKVGLNREEKALIYQWVGHIKDEEAIKGMNLITENIKKYAVKNLIADLNEFKGGSVTIAKWVNDVWSKQLKDAGLEKLAVNVPQSAFGEFSNKLALGANTVSLLKVNKFTAYTDAYTWFKDSK